MSMKCLIKKRVRDGHYEIIEVKEFNQYQLVVTLRMPVE